MPSASSCGRNDPPIAGSGARATACRTGALPMQRHRVAWGLPPHRWPPSRSELGARGRAPRCRSSSIGTTPMSPNRSSAGQSPQNQSDSPYSRTPAVCFDTRGRPCMFALRREREPRTGNGELTRVRRAGDLPVPRRQGLRRRVAWGFSRSSWEKAHPALRNLCRSAGSGRWARRGPWGRCGWLAVV
jgi:hypothetical protein